MSKIDSKNFSEQELLDVQQQLAQLAQVTNDPQLTTPNFGLQFYYKEPSDQQLIDEIGDHNSKNYPSSEQYGYGHVAVDSNWIKYEPESTAYAHTFDYKDIPQVKLDPGDLNAPSSTYAQEKLLQHVTQLKKKKSKTKENLDEINTYESLTKCDTPMSQDSNELLQQETQEKNIQHKILHESLEDIVEYIRKQHFGVNKEIYALKLIRQFDGKKIPIEEMRGITLQNISIHDKRTLILTQKAALANTGPNISPYPFFESNLYLSELIMINVYDYSAEFISETNFDFTYSLQTKDAKTVMLAEWVHKKPKNLRAQWACDTDTEKLLESIGEGPKIHRQVSIPRGIDLE